MLNLIDMRAATHKVRDVYELLSISFLFWLRTVTLGSPESVKRLEDLMEGYGIYLDRARSGNLERSAARLAIRFYYRAEDGVRELRRSAKFVRRCKREALREHAKTVKAEPDETKVLFTLMSYREELSGPYPIVVSTLLRRYLWCNGSTTALVLAPRWFYQLLEHTWPGMVWGSRSGSPDNAGSEYRSEEARRAGLGKAHPSADLDLDAVSKLWDPDPLGLYFELDELLETLARV